MLPSALYNQRIATGLLQPDAGQAAAVAALDRLAVALANQANGQPFWQRPFTTLFGSGLDAPRGLYLYGPVGRGKSLLMDLLLETVSPAIMRRRQHFHQFMREVHQKLNKARSAGASDPLALVTAEIVATVQLLCFDELFVKDVADAMILSRLFTALVEAGVVIFFTTNCAPQELYAGGLQRVRFLPFIALLESKLDIVRVSGPEDHRLTHLQSAGTYLTPLSEEATAQLVSTFAKLTNTARCAPAEVLVDGRMLRLKCSAAGVLHSSFAELCQSNLGPGDMLEIAACFHTVLLDGVPQMGGSNAEGKNEATRFITLIDALYDARRNLVIAAAAPADQLYQNGALAFEFQRTASRLIEMQTSDYQRDKQASN